MSRTATVAITRKYAVPPAPTSGGWLSVLVVVVAIGGVVLLAGKAALIFLAPRPIATARLWTPSGADKSVHLAYRSDEMRLPSGAAYFKVDGGQPVDVLEHRVVGARGMARVRTARGEEGWTEAYSLEDVRATKRN